MALFMSRFAYTAESWSDLMKHPEDRTQVVSELLERHGCHLEHLWYAFGEDDGYAVMPGGLTRVTAGLSAPGGDPRVFQVDGAEIALRRETAKRLRVRLAAGRKPRHS